MSAGSDKRRFPREHRRAKVTLGTATLFTTDISTGGFCVELMRVLVRDSSVNGTLHYEGKSFAFAGVVAWAKGGDARLGLRGRMGIQFTSIDAAFAELLAAAPRRGR